MSVRSPFSKPDLWAPGAALQWWEGLVLVELGCVVPGTQGNSKVLHLCAAAALMPHSKCVIINYLNFANRLSPSPTVVWCTAVLTIRKLYLHAFWSLPHLALSLYVWRRIILFHSKNCTVLVDCCCQLQLVSPSSSAYMSPNPSVFLRGYTFLKQNVNSLFFLLGILHHKYPIHN